MANEAARASRPLESLIEKGCISERSDEDTNDVVVAEVVVVGVEVIKVAEVAIAVVVKVEIQGVESTKG